MGEAMCPISSTTVIIIIINSSTTSNIKNNKGKINMRLER